MAQRVFYYQEDLTRTTSSNTTYSATKLTKDFTPTSGKTYAVFWSCLLDNNVTLRRSYVRIYNSTDAVVLAENILEIEVAGTVERQVAGGVCLYTAASGDLHTFTMDYQTAGTSSPVVGISEAKMLILELVDGLDQWNSSTGTSTRATTTYSSKLNLTWTPATVGDYLVICSSEGQCASSSVRTQLNINSGTIVNTYDTLIANGSNNTWCPAVGAYRMSSASTSQKTADIDFASSSTGTVSMRNAYLVALRLDAFDGYFWAEDRTLHTNVTSGSYADSATTGSITPKANTHAAIAIGQSSSVDGAYTDAASLKITRDAGDIGTVFAKQYGYAGNWYGWICITVVTPTNASQTWKTQYARSAGAGSGSMSDEHVLALLQLDANPSQQDVSATGMSASSGCGGGPIICPSGR